MLKGKRGTELLSTSCHVSRDLFVSQILAKIKPEIKGFDKIWLSLATRHLSPQAVGSSVWLSAAWGVPLPGSPHESCWLALRSAWMVMRRISADRRSRCARIQQDLTDTEVLKQPSLLWSQTDVTAAGESCRSKTSSSGFKETWKIPALGQWYLGNFLRGEFWASIFLSLLLFSKGFKWASSVWSLCWYMPPKPTSKRCVFTRVRDR